MSNYRQPRTLTIKMRRYHIPTFLLACFIVLVKGKLEITLEDTGAER